MNRTQPSNTQSTEQITKRSPQPSTIQQITTLSTQRSSTQQMVSHS